MISLWLTHPMLSHGEHAGSGEGLALGQKAELMLAMLLNVIDRPLHPGAVEQSHCQIWSAYHRETSNFIFGQHEGPKLEQLPDEGHLHFLGDCFG